MHHSLSAVLAPELDWFHLTSGSAYVERCWYGSHELAKAMMSPSGNYEAVSAKAMASHPICLPDGSAHSAIVNVALHAGDPPVVPKWAERSTPYLKLLEIHAAEKTGSRGARLYESLMAIRSELDSRPPHFFLAGGEEGDPDSWVLEGILPERVYRTLEGDVLRGHPLRLEIELQAAPAWELDLPASKPRVVPWQPGKEDGALFGWIRSITWKTPSSGEE